MAESAKNKLFLFINYIKQHQQHEYTLWTFPFQTIFLFYIRPIFFNKNFKHLLPMDNRFYVFFHFHALGWYSKRISVCVIGKDWEENIKRFCCAQIWIARFSLEILLKTVQVSLDYNAQFIAAYSGTIRIANLFNWLLPKALTIHSHPKRWRLHALTLGTVCGSIMTLFDHDDHSSIYHWNEENNKCVIYNPTIRLNYAESVILVILCS